MLEVFSQFSATIWIMAALVAFLGGLVKGIVGFALPMIMVSGLGVFLSPELVVAGLILPTLVTNFGQAFRNGVSGVGTSMRRFRRFLLIAGVMLICSAQLVALVPQQVYFLVIGVPITLFVIAQIIGWVPSRVEQSARLDFTLGGIAGFIGGMSGVWGPPTVAYLTALNTPKTIQMQTQGVIYGLGALVLTAAHIGSGIMNMTTVWLSLGLAVPACIGMIAGTAIQDRINQAVFRRTTLLVLLLAGINLVRRGLID